jgi:hypothetical protein
MNAYRLAAAAAIAALTLLGFFFFPGHTFLQSDTQIYMPMLERLWDPSALGRDLIATRPHLDFTIYDETVLLARRIFGLEFRTTLVAEQLLFRFLGLCGIYLIARSLEFPRSIAVWVTAMLALGATILGPAVLIWEYEPVPRGFAVPLLFLAIGLAAREEALAAGIAGALAFLYHPPTVFPFWIAYFLLVLMPHEPRIMRSRQQGLIPMAISIAALLLMAKLHHGESENQVFFSKIDTFTETLQRLRAPYNWVSGWGAQVYFQYLLLATLAGGALYRLRRYLPETLGLFAICMTVLGLLSMLASLILLEGFKWALIPQFQPARAVLFVTAFAAIGAALSAAAAHQERNKWECFGWLCAAFAIPTQTNLTQLLWPFGDPVIGWRLVVIVGLSAATVLAFQIRKEAAVAVACAAMFVIPEYGNVVNYPRIHTAALDQLSHWASASTPAGAVFHFPDAGRGLTPGIFRATSVRAIFVDWKSGGQVNFMKSLGEEWWRRWQPTLGAGYKPAPPESYAALGADYVVLQAQNRIAGANPVMENSGFVVYKTRP